MNGLTIPRHGARRAVVSTNHPLSARLPGAINAGSYDGHVKSLSDGAIELGGPR